MAKLSIKKPEKLEKSKGKNKLKPNSNPTEEPAVESKKQKKVNTVFENDVPDTQRENGKFSKKKAQKKQSKKDSTDIQQPSKTDSTDIQQQIEDGSKDNVKKQKKNVDGAGKAKQKKIKNNPKLNGQKKTKKQKPKAKVPQSGVPLLKTVIPKTYPAELTVLVSKLPQNFKQIEIIEVFSKFGTITYVQNLSKRSAIIAFLNQEEAETALREMNGKNFKGYTIKVQKRPGATPESQVTQKDADRTIIVARLSSKTTGKDIDKHFKSCGKIISIIFTKRRFALILFETVEGSQAALNLHNTILNDATINVRLRSNPSTPWDLKRTVVLLNVDGLNKLEGSVITSIFEKCGDIEKCDVICQKNKLAMITFKEEAGVTKALRLNNTHQEGINIQVQKLLAEVEKFAIPMKIDTHEELLEQAKDQKCKVYIKKLGKDITEDEIRSCFESCGPIKSITISPNRACTIGFKNSEGYCKAFAMRDIEIRGQRLSLLPFSSRPSKEKKDKKKPSKRPAAEAATDVPKKKNKKSTK